MQARPDSADGDCEDEGYLLVGKFFKLAENDDLLEEEGKVFEAFADDGDGLGAGELLGGVVVGRWWIEGLIGGFEGDEALAAVEVTPELTAGDSAEPGREACALGIVAVGLPEESEEDLLSDLFCYGIVAAEAEDVAIDERGMAAI